MSHEPLCIRTFAEVIRSRMSKKAHIKNFDPDKKIFQSDAEAKNNAAIKLSQVFNFYKLLLDAIVYKAIAAGEEGIPDIASSMTTQLKNGKSEIRESIIEIAQRKDAKMNVTDYFEANLVPNIPEKVCSSVLDDIDELIGNSKDIKGRKRNTLKQAYRQRKSDASYLAEVYLLAVCNGVNEIEKDQLSLFSDTGKKNDPFEALEQLEASIARLPVPKQISPPKQISEEEQPYISELYAAYGDKEGINDFCEAHLSQYEEYNEDRNDRRIDYFAADSIRHSVRELKSDKYKDQFTILKDETWAGVKNTARKSYPNGYEKMLSIMEQAAIIQVTQYTLSRSPYWISNNIKMGVCHILVNDNKLEWVKK